MRTLSGSLALAGRSLLRSPRFSLLAVLPLALAVGATTALVSIVQGVLFEPLPFRDSHDLLRVLRATPDGVEPWHSGPNLLELAERQTTLAGLAGYLEGEAIITPMGEPQVARAVQVSRDFFATLAARPALGRFFRPEENEPEADGAVVLSHSAFLSRFAADSSVVGATVLLDGRPVTVVGVAEPGFVYPEGAEVWRPLAYGPRIRDDRFRGGNMLSVVGRLAPGRPLASAREDLGGIFADIGSRFPGSGTLQVVGLRDHVVGALDRPLMLLVVAMGFVLLIASANVANLLLGRGAAREVELAVRRALGADRRHLLTLLVAEGALLAATAAALGGALAAAVVAGVRRLAPPGLARVADLEVDVALLGLGAAGCAAVTVAFTVLPALLHARTDALGVLGSAGRGSRRHGTALRRGLIVAEVALCLPLLTGAGLMLRSFARLASVDTGMVTSGLVAADVALRLDRYQEPGATEAFAERLEEALLSRPGVTGAALASGLPLEGAGTRMTFEIAGRPPADPANASFLNIRAVSPGFFVTLAIPILRGEGFERADGPGAPQVAILSASAERRFFPGESALGQRIVLARRGVEARVIGIAGDVHATSLTTAPEPHIYLPIAQFTMADLTVIVSRDPRARGPDPGRGASTGDIAGALAEVDPELAFSNARRMDDVVEGVLARPRSVARLLSAASALALLLAATGIFGVVAYQITSRRREMGIRGALGADPSGLLWEATTPALAMIGAGLVLGLAASLLTARVVGAFLFEVRAVDPVAFSLAVLALLVTGVAAAVLPALQAVRAAPRELLTER